MVWITESRRQEYYNSIFALYASWGVDFVKVDDIANLEEYPQNPYGAEKEIEMIRHAIDVCGRDMVLSLSPGPAVIEKSMASAYKRQYVAYGPEISGITGNR